MDRSRRVKLKQYFCNHYYIVREVRFQYGLKIPASASSGLTKIVSYNWDATLTSGAPYTKIKTHYVVSMPYVYLYMKECVHCKQILPCTALEAQEKERQNTLLKSEGLC